MLRLLARHSASVPARVSDRAVSHLAQRSAVAALLEHLPVTGHSLRL